MKTNMTHKILVLISKEAIKRGYTTTLTYEFAEWWLEIWREDKGTKLIKRTSRISDIEDWLK
ncbi:MAG: hypothetical protein GY817_05130 [bacterium]|nr:hypothetical protein [bacterium]